MSYKAMVRVTGETEFTGNALRFATRYEAESYGCNLQDRWTAAREVRVEESGDPVTDCFTQGRVIRIKSLPMPKP